MSICGPNYLFLGSRLGNSLLLKYKPKDSLSIGEEPVIKKPKLDEKEEDFDNFDNFDLVVYGENDAATVKESSSIMQYTFEVCDSLLNIGPCGRAVLGEPPFLSDEFSRRSDPDVELITSSGYGKNGAICVLQRTIRPQIVTTFELSGTIDMWTIFHNNSDDHSFLILSREDCSMVLQTGQEILELDNTGFTTDESTIFASNIGRYIIQVTTSSVQLLFGEKNIQKMPVDMGSPICHCSVDYPYVFLLDQNGQVLQFTLREVETEQGYAKLMPTQPMIALVRLK